VSNLAIDELRRQKRLTTLPDTDSHESASSALAAQPSPDMTVLAELVEEDLRSLIVHAPISERSRRVVIGRFLDDLPDEALAHTESELSQSEILPSHVQVTRAKNLAKLRDWPPLRILLSQP
jgi:DNA-directed RNA polymerase specialized sigma24 family protein